jgi:CheY-like chemotaxis protein/HPt (histidine-containing phosphotransfer) domain-containing protein
MSGLLPDAQTTTPPQRPRPIVVLLVDDQAFVGAAVRHLLASESDIELHCCTQAVNAITVANQLKPTIVLQDLVMPEIDGLTLVRAFRENPLTARTPVIVLSGSDDADTRRRALAAGAQGYLAKLPPKAELIACLRGYTSRQDAPPDTLDRAVIDGFREAGAPDFTRRLITQFLDEAAASVQALRAAASGQDEAMLKATAHRLRGSSMIMGASRLAGLCGQVEDPRTALGAAASGLLLEIADELIRVQRALALERDGMA